MSAPGTPLVKSLSWRGLVALAAVVLLAVAPVVGTLLHADHDGPECPACKLATQALVAHPPSTSLEVPSAQPGMLRPEVVGAPAPV